MLTLLSTKLFLPPQRPSSVARPRLVARLNAGIGRRLTLIAAPAGFGKTTLLSQWLAGAGRPVAWLALDEPERDVTQFLAYLVAALRTARPEIGAGALALLDAAQPQPEAVLTELMNDLAASPAPLALALDDFHAAASEATASALAFLIERAPPSLHVAVAARELPGIPLARLRARGELSELSAADLRFGSDEVAEFLARAAGLSLSAGAVAALEARTEGWAAGLQLAGLSLHGQPDPEALVETFSGSHRHVLDYLLDEVLAQQPPDVQNFLLRTAALDRLCGALCDALLGADDSSAVLARLERANLFLVPLDAERRWYRYHHLFAEALRRRREHPGAVDVALADDHRRASAWHESQGLLAEAVHHAAAAGDSARVARLAEQTWQAMDRRFQTVVWLGWVRRLPETVVRGRPLLSTQYAWALMDNGDIDGAGARLDAAEAALAALPLAAAAEQDASLPAMIAMARAYCAMARAEFDAAAVYARRAAEGAPEHHTLLQAQTAALVGLSSWARGELDAAHRAFATWIDQMRRAETPAFATAALFGLVESRVAQGRLRDALAECRAAQAFVAEQDESVRRVAVHLTLSAALLRIETGDRQDAERLLREARTQGERGPFAEWAYRWLLARAHLAEAEGRRDEALALLDDAARRFVRTPLPDLRPVDALRARVYLRLGRVERARSWARERGLADDDPLSYLRAFEHTVLARLRLAEGRHDAALALLGRLLAAAESGGWRGGALEVLLLQALAHSARGASPEALAALDRALALGEAEGYLQTFLDEGPPLARLLALAAARGVRPAYAARLLAAFGQPAAAADDDAPPVERLSQRELEVLRLVAQGLSNEAIAERLSLALSTVKGHNRVIFEKLQVSRRTAAVARARALGLLDP